MSLILEYWSHRKDLCKRSCISTPHVEVVNKAEGITWRCACQRQASLTGGTRSRKYCWGGEEQSASESVHSWSLYTEQVALKQVCGGGLHGRGTLEKARVVNRVAIFSKSRGEYFYYKQCKPDLCPNRNHLRITLAQPGADGAVATEAMEALDNLMTAITSLKWPRSLSSVSLTICCVCPVLYVAASFTFTAQLLILSFPCLSIIWAFSLSSL